MGRNDSKFNRWMKKVDSAIFEMIGCSVYDLEDYLFYDDFEAGISPEETAMEVIRNDSLASYFFPDI
jgi:hypothetical protein